MKKIDQKIEEFLKFSCSDEKTNKFRMLNIGICNSKTHHEDTVKDIEDKHGIEDSVVKEVRELNKKVRKMLNNKYSFQFYLSEDEKVDKINDRYKDKMKKMSLKLNDRLSELKFKVEKNLSKKE